MKRLLMILPVISCLAGCGGNSKPIADTVVFGTIYTAENENNSEAQAFAIKDGKYIFVGSKEDAQETSFKKEKLKSLIILA